MKKKAPTTPFNVPPTVLMDSHLLDPAPYNPQKMPLAKFEALKLSIRTYGFVDPIVAQKKTNRIIGGHHRLKGTKEICVEDGVAMPKLPVILLDVSDRDAKKLSMALNNHGDPDPQLLGELLFSMRQDAPFAQEEIQVMGLTGEDVDKYIHLVDPDPPPNTNPDPPSTFGKSVTLNLEFDDVRLRNAVKDVLTKKTKTAKKKSGELVAGLLKCRVSP